jgi:2-polyprenyl-3-methyl-5-hydroxy-6-metoxy-1,4-benzoquinol methylase
MALKTRDEPTSMDHRAAIANAAAYNSYASGGAEECPHMRYETLRRLYARLAADVFTRATRRATTPRVLDLGAGDGTVTRTFLELGASVTAIDVSEVQLSLLAARNQDYLTRLTIRQGEALSVLQELQRDGERFDVGVAVSFLHHVPDYMPVVLETADVLEPHGQLLTFQDPMLKTTMTLADRAVSRIAYVSWRLLQRDAIGGVARHVRRRRGIWLDDCAADNVEYHELRAGVDQHAITHALDERGFDCELILYFSTQSSLWQWVGDKLEVRNKFGVVATRDRAPTGISRQSSGRPFA